MKAKNKILIPLIIATLAITSTFGATTTSQLLLNEANAQGATTLQSGDLTAVGGEKIGSYAITPSGQRVEVHLHLDKAPTAGNVWAAWLLDNQTNSALSMGQVETDIQPPSLTFTQFMVNPNIYDHIIVTEEPQNDPDPTATQPIGGAALEPPFGS